MPRKLQQPQIQQTKFQQTLIWMKSKPIYTLIIVLFIVSLSLLASILIKSPPKEPVIEVTQPTVTVNPLSTLEAQIEKQNVLIQKLEAQNSNLENNLKLLEKRLQAHTDVMKRICEYIVIITVDKKIIPRQCTLEYKWLREEGQ
jgi:septal ring factor EnvC (AmiA/AmiB activator)